MEGEVAAPGGSLVAHKKKVLFVFCNSDKLRSILKDQQGILVNRVF